eukprot:6200952-Pleurochrysis_carterae.AAC.3
MLPIRTMSQTAILHHSRGRSVISINVNTVYVRADCFRSSISRSQQQQQAVTMYCRFAVRAVTVTEH